MLADRVEYRYNRQAERVEKKDQNETVHVYEFDALGRLIHDRVISAGSGVDDAALRISTSYEVRGMVEKITSYDNPTVGSGATLNEVVFEYNDLGALVKDHQEHAGAKTANTPYVGYNYDTTASGGAFTKGARRSSTRYPNGRLLRFEYSAPIDDAINRVTFLADDDGGSVGTHLAEYSYLGLGGSGVGLGGSGAGFGLPSPASSGRGAGGEGIVQVNYPEPALRYDLAHGGGNDPYAGLDRFDRVVDLLWRNYGASTDAVRIQHGYDRSGNRLWREDPVAATNGVHLDELYSYDGMSQLTHRERGDLNANHDAITSKNFAEDWTLDMTGNWPVFKQDTDGDGNWDLNQSRTHGKANEILQIAGSSSHVAHDRAGNMVKTPKPDAWSAHFDVTWDAWNRLVKVMDGETVVATYAYDGRNFRITKTASGTTRHFYYSSAWQCLEERLPIPDPQSLIPVSQHVWGLRYIDDLLLRDRDADSNSGTGSLGLTGSGLEERLYSLQDPNWNVVAISSTAGAILERHCYTAYGKPTFLTGAFGSRGSSSYAWDVLYTGRQYDAETGFGCFRNRILLFDLGRFGSRDPIGYEGHDLNLYRYVANSCTNAIDPFGLQLPPWIDLFLTGAEIKKCCDDALAAAKGKRENPDAATICCKCRPVTCVFADKDTFRKRGITNETALTIIVNCLTDHERSHKDDTKCRQNQTGYDNPIDQGNDHTKWSECKALQATVGCLIKASSTEPCKSDKSCTDDIDRYGGHQQKKMKAMGCKEILEKGDPTKPPQKGAMRTGAAGLDLIMWRV